MSETRRNEQKLLEVLCQAYPEGLSSSQLAEQVGLTAQAVRDIIDRIGDDTGISQEGAARATRYFLNPKHYKRPFNLTTTQSWMLYLAIRRIVRAQQHRLPVVKKLIQDLSLALHHSVHVHFAISDTEEQADDVLETLVDAWQTHHWVRINYRPLNRTQPYDWQIAPAWFEPAIWSDSNYVVGMVKMGNRTEERMTLKLDRIEGAWLTGDTFTPPNIAEILATTLETWGIWTKEDGASPEEVILHFDARVYDRLHETHWHPTQSIHLLTNGKVEWRATISEPKEMMPWIRGWGADVEVISPQWLRDEIGAEAERMAQMYGRMNDDDRGFF